ncbi:hypothetical protein [Aliiruegeria lutimaris]|uniref:hypothetical protein n=1 Tax=Aliiruegeria lutimaris TaxID=571298 RepID=UPI000B85A9BA|nr:hypothetical protein [Aliiruegeria lutimaris]
MELVADQTRIGCLNSKGQPRFVMINLAHDLLTFVIKRQEVTRRGHRIALELRQHAPAENPKFLRLIVNRNLAVISLLQHCVLERNSIAQESVS